MSLAHVLEDCLDEMRVAERLAAFTPWVGVIGLMVWESHVPLSRTEHDLATRAILPVFLAPFALLWLVRVAARVRAGTLVVSLILFSVSWGIGLGPFQRSLHGSFPKGRFKSANSWVYSWEGLKTGIESVGGWATAVDSRFDVTGADASEAVISVWSERDTPLNFASYVRESARGTRVLPWEGGIPIEGRADREIQLQVRIECPPSLGGQRLSGEVTAELAFPEKAGPDHYSVCRATFVYAIDIRVPPRSTFAAMGQAQERSGAVVVPVALLLGLGPSSVLLFVGAVSRLRRP